MKNTERITARTREVRYDGTFATFDLEGVNVAPKLRKVYVRSPNLTALSLEPLRDKPLEWLQLVTPAVTSLDLSPIAASTTLKELRLYPGPAPLDLAPLAGCRALSDLYVGDCSAPVLDLSPLGNIPLLRNLSLYCNGVRTLDLQPLATLPELRLIYINAPQLERVELGTSPGFAALTDFVIMDAPLAALDLAALAPGTFLKAIRLPARLDGAVDFSKLPKPSKRFEIEFR